MTEPRILVYSSLFPSAAAPTSGTFIRERAFRVGKRFPIVVVSPQPWSPLDGLVRLVRKTFRPKPIEFEIMDGVQVFRPRYFSLPGVLKALDGWSMARGSMALARRLQREFQPNVIDAHFLFPDGYAASLLGRALGLPVTITLRGSKDWTLLGTSRERFMRRAAASATRLFSVSDALRRSVGEKLTGASERICVVANGVDSDKFRPVDRAEARRRLGIAPEARVLIGVGALVKGKGFHHVIPLMKRLRRTFPDLLYLIVGGGASQGDMRAKLEALAYAEGVADAVRFCGRQLQDDLPLYYGAADLFVLATAYEGWANVLLEAMACGLPIVTTRVGGNEEVVSSPALGELVEYWDADKFAEAIERSLRRDWDRNAIVAYAQSNSWDRRVELLEREFRVIVAGVADPTAWRRT